MGASIKNSLRKGTGYYNIKKEERGKAILAFPATEKRQNRKEEKIEWQEQN